MGKSAFFTALVLSLLLVSRPVFAIQAGNPAPGFTLEDTAGRPVSISGLRDKVIVLNFFSVTCPPCKSEISTLNRLYGKFKPVGLVVIGVTKDTAGELKDFESGQPINYPVIIDKRSAAYVLYEVLPIPVTFLIGKDGVIAERLLGPPDPQALETEIVRLLL